MSRFIKTIEDVTNAGLPLDYGTDLNVLDRHFVDSENNFVKPVLGSAFLDEIVAGLDEEIIDPKWSALLPYLQAPVAYNGYYLFYKIPGGQISHRGYQRDRADHSEHAPKWEIDSLKESLICKGDFALDALIKFLQDNSSIYPTWEVSDYYLKNSGLIIPTANVFNEFVNISCSGKVFQTLLHFRLQAERALIRVTCKPLFDRIQNELKGVDGALLSDEIENLLDYLRPLVAYDAMARGIKKLNFVYTDSGIYTYSYTDGTLTKKAISMSEAKELSHEWHQDFTNARDEAIAFMVANIEDYPEYANSDCYQTTPSTLVSRYENDITKKHFGI